MFPGPHVRFDTRRKLPADCLRLPEFSPGGNAPDNAAQVIARCPADAMPLYSLAQRFLSLRCARPGAPARGDRGQLCLEESKHRRILLTSCKGAATRRIVLH